MAKVKIQGHASGTGILTVTAPNTSTDRTITLPDSTATIATTTDVAARLPSITDNGNANAITIDSSENVDLAGANLTMTDGSLKSGVSGTFNIFGATGTAGSAAYCTYGFNGDDNTGMYSGTADTIKFATGGSEKVRIQSGGGISFNGDTAAANALDDYEEGTFSFSSVSIAGGSGAISVKDSENLLSYTKIGNLVRVSGRIEIDAANAAGGRFMLNGLPFTSLDGSEESGDALFLIQLQNGTGSQASGFFSNVLGGTTTIYVRKYTGVGVTNDSAVTLQADTEIYISGTYPAA